MMLAAASSPTAAQEPAEDDARPEVRAGIGVLLGFFVLFLGWTALVPLDAAIVAPGVITVSGNRQTVQHRDGGTVARLYVREGQRVRAGDVLIELAAPEIVAQQGALAAQVTDMRAEAARIDAEANGAGVTEYGAKIRGYEGEMAANATQRRLLAQELEGMRTLVADQLVPLPRVRALERTLAELQGRDAELHAAIATTREERSSQLRRTRAKLGELLPQLAAARARREDMRIRAPVSGTVVGLTAHTEGGVLKGGERAMDIVPADPELVIEARLRPEESNDLRPGMKTEIRFSAFKGRNLPTAHGMLRSISADRFVDEHSGLPYFTVQIGVSGAEFGRITRGSGQRLTPGLPAEILVATRKRTALDYLIEPLNQSLWRSFRES